MAATDNVIYDFRYLPGKKYPSVESKDSKDWLIKWGLDNRIRIQCFSFDQEFRSYRSQEFVEAFFKDAEVIRNLAVLTSSNKWSTIGQTPTKVKVSTVPATILSMNFFDRLQESGIVRESGMLQKCMDEFIDDFCISDELRKMFLMEESDHYDLYSETEKEELLFRLLRHICLGGQLCQYEDYLTPYTDLTKALYKDLVTVMKEPDSKQMRIISHVLKVSCEDDTVVFYPTDEDHEQDFSYLVVDPLKRHVTVCYHRFGSGTPE